MTSSINVVYMLFIINVLHMAIAGITYPVIPLYIVGSGLSVVVAGIVTSIASITGFSFQIIWGYISDRIRSRLKILIWCSTIMTLAFIFGIILHHNILAVQLSYILSTIGGAGVGVASYALVADVSHKNLRKSMSIYWAGGSLGWAMSLLIAGWILKAFGIVGILLFSLIFSIMILVCVLLHPSIDKNGIVRSTGVNKVTLRPIIRLLSNKVFLVLYLSSFMFMVGDIVKNIYIPQYHAYEVGLGEAYATTILSLASWFEIPAILLFGRILAIIGEAITYTLGLALMALYLYLNSIVNSFIVAALIMMFYSMVWASYITSISVIVPLIVDEENRGLALGLINSNFALANILFNIVLSYMVKVQGYTRTFISVALLMVLLMLIVVFVFFRMKYATKSLVRGSLH